MGARNECIQAAWQNAAGGHGQEQPERPVMTDNSIIEALRALHKAIAHRTTMPFDEFVEHLKDFDIYPIRDRGEVIGAVMTRGNEIHLGVTRTPEGAHLRELRSILAGIKIGR